MSTAYGMSYHIEENVECIVRADTKSILDQVLRDVHCRRADSLCMRAFAR